ncbi:MAG: hypothetical protein KF901_30560 [Myxococcales bacterium]|nr:hypothetical protein [Myxococcales bacterium]
MRTLLYIAALSLGVACGGDDETVERDAGPDSGNLDGGGFGVDGGPRDAGPRDSGPPPSPTATGYSVTSGGGEASSATHRAVLSVGAPVPRGEASSATHHVVLGPAFVAR